VIEVCGVADVPPGEGRAATIAGRRVAIFHAESGWHALDDACPHRGGPLSDGLVAEACVVCPLHDRRFALADGAPLTDGNGVTAHRIEVRDERVYVELTPADALASAA
jgi:nitrite reductase (NADH) small subunit